jgi:dUTP pyrophosphatase
MTLTTLAIDIPIERCRPGAVLPRYANLTDGGMDIVCPEAVAIPAGKTVIVPTGLKVAVPEGWMLLVFPRSGISAKTGLRVANSPGLIDAGYRDEVGIILHNTAAEDFSIEPGMRIAQFVLVQRTEIRFAEVGSVKDIGTDRGGGFGSSGV